MQNYLSTSEAAEILGISRTAVLKQIQAGKLKAERTGRNYVIAREDLPEVLATHMSEQVKKAVDQAVRRTVKEYGETLKRLGKE